METVLIGLCIAISGGVIGYVRGYNNGSDDMQKAMTEGMKGIRF